jgi:hypothetical protein
MSCRRTFNHEIEGKDVQLSKEEVDIIKRLTGDEYADKDMNPYEVKL